MSDMEERTERSTPRVAVMEPASFDDEDPPGKPRRHPLWRNVPKKQWDDWRWQSQNAIRSVRQLRDLLPFSDEELEVMRAQEALSETDAARDLGIFGSPTFTVGRELFWGDDRLNDAIAWCRSGRHW